MSLMQLEKDCKKCEGTGYETSGRRSSSDDNRRLCKIKCYFCEDGKIPSEQGQALLDFLEKHGKFVKTWQLHEEIRSIN